jgi:hypothetical protein
MDIDEKGLYGNKKIVATFATTIRNLLIYKLLMRSNQLH